MTLRISRILVSLMSVAALPVVLSCKDPTAPKVAKVQWKLDSPLCGSLTFRFAIDHVDVDSIQLYHDHTSPAYSTSAGTHAVTTLFPNGIVFRDTTVTLKAGETYTDVVEFYCS